MSGDAGEVDDDAAFFIGGEESLPLLGGVLCVNGVGDVGVDDESTSRLEG